MPLATNLKINLISKNKRDIVNFFYKYKAQKFSEESRLPHPLDYKRLDEFFDYYTVPQLLFSMKEFIDMCYREKRACSFPLFCVWVTDYSFRAMSDIYSKAAMLKSFGPQNRMEKIRQSFNVIREAETTWFPDSSIRIRFKEAENYINETVESLYK